jgi:hypothetical protein
LFDLCDIVQYKFHYHLSLIRLKHVNLPFKSTILIHIEVPNVTKVQQIKWIFFSIVTCTQFWHVCLWCLQSKMFLNYFHYTKLSNQITSMRKSVCSIDFFYFQLNCGLTYWSLAQIIYSCVITLLIIGTKHELWKPRWLHCLHVVLVGWIGIASVHLQVHNGWHECVIKSTKHHLQEHGYPYQWHYYLSPCYKLWVPFQFTLISNFSSSSTWWSAWICYQIY